MSKQRGPMPTVVFEGRVYHLLRRNVTPPDFGTMERLAALIWLNQNTRARGYQKPVNPLIGFGNAIKLG